MEVERLQREYDVQVRWAPYLLDPTTPPEGKPRKPQTRPDDPPTQIEARGAEGGLTFRRGRTWTSNSHLALEAAEWCAEMPEANAFHRAMFKAYFDDLEDIGDIEVILRTAASVGLDVEALRPVLENRELKDQVDQGILWAREVGVTGVPTFVFEEKWAVVGAQDYNVFESLVQKLGKQPKNGAAPDA